MNTFGFRAGDDTGAFVSVCLSLFVAGLIVLSTLWAAVMRDAERYDVAIGGELLGSAP